MIIMQIYGGLGNQMFQYALAKSLAEKYHDVLRFDFTWFDRNPKDRPFQLDVFQVECVRACTEDIGGRDQKSKWKHAWYKLMGIFHGKRLMKISEHKLGYGYHPDKVFRDSKGKHLMYDGYWQTEKYFLETEAVIRRDFTFKGSFTEETKRVAEEIRGEKCAVSLHIRRGDYIGNTLGVLTMDYYERAITYIGERRAHPRFFIFSNDIPWVREHLAIPFSVTYVDHNDEAHGYEDMYLMSLCHDHIIANSTFSWWGAWLNPRKDKLVVGPKQWFKSGPKTDQKDLRHVIPETWVKLENDFF